MIRKTNYLQGKLSLMTENLELYRVILRVSHALRHGHGEPELKMAPGQKRVLTALARRETMTQRDLLDEMGLARATLSELLTRLEDRGLIERTRSKADRRVTILSLTRKGKIASGKIIDVESRIADEAFAPLGADEKEQLARMLAVMLDSWKS